MLDWFTVTCGGAALYAAGKLLIAVKIRRKRSKPEQQKKGKFGQPLRLVVAQCEARWFLQELKSAMDGDTEAMVRVAHMLMAGYGTQQDHTAAAQWMRQAWAIQNYKEPGQLHEMLDVRDSAIPALNEANRRPAGNTTGSTAAAAATNLSRVNHSSRRIVGSATAAATAAAAADSKGSMQTAVQSEKGDSVAACLVQQGDAAIQAVMTCCMQGLQPNQQQQRKQPQPSVLFQQQQQYNQQQQQQRRQAERESGLVAATKHCRRALRQQKEQRAVAAITGPLRQQQQQQVVVAAATVGAIT